MCQQHNSVGTRRATSYPVNSATENEALDSGSFPHYCLSGRFRSVGGWMPVSWSNVRLFILGIVVLAVFVAVAPTPGCLQVRRATRRHTNFYQPTQERPGLLSVDSLCAIS